MIDENGLNDACYVPLNLSGADSIGIGLAVTYAPETVPVSPDPSMLKRNPQLIRRLSDGAVRVYHPSKAVAASDRHAILFDRWVPWAAAAKCQIVLRCDTRKTPKVLLARPDEKDVFTFDDPKGGKLKYINLDFYTNRDDFPAVYIRIGPRAAGRFVRVSAGLSKGMPVVTATAVGAGQVPQQLARA